MTQLSLFDDDAYNDARPLPEIIAAQFHFPLQSHDTDTGVMYAVQDWMRGLMQKDDVSSDWKHLKKRAGQTLKSVQPLKYKATDGKTYKRDFTDAEGLYAIAQYMSAKTGLRDKVLAYLAKSGVKLDEYRRDPALMMAEGASRLERKAQRLGWSGEQLMARREGADARVLMTDAIKDAVSTVLTGKEYAHITDTEYRELYGRSTRELREALGLPDRANLRDHQPVIALTYQRAAEQIIAERVRGQLGMGFTECLELVGRVCRMIGRQIKESGAELGIDIPTGLPLLGAVTQVTRKAAS